METPNLFCTFAKAELDLGPACATQDQSRWLPCGISFLCALYCEQRWFLTP